jgi:hypothetical protein
VLQFYRVRYFLQFLDAICDAVSRYYRLLAVNAIYIQGTLIDNFATASREVSSIADMLMEFEARKLPTTAGAAFNMTKPPLVQVHALMFESGLQQQLKLLESSISANQKDFRHIYEALKALQFDRIQGVLTTVSEANSTGENIFGKISGEFSNQNRVLKTVTYFSKKLNMAMMWTNPWISSSWPWLFCIMLSFLTLQSVMIRSFSMFSTVITAATCLQLVISFLAFILFAASIIINDVCSLFPAASAENWHTVTESSFFWNRVGSSCLSKQQRNIYAVFDPHEAASCDSFLNVSQYSSNVIEVLSACENLHNAAWTSNLSAVQVGNPNFAAGFSAIRSSIDQLSAPLRLQWPQIFDSIHQTSKNCALYLERYAHYVFHKTATTVF